MLCRPAFLRWATFDFWVQVRTFNHAELGSSASSRVGLGRAGALGFQCAGRGVVAFVAMSTTNRLNVVPTVTVLAVIKNRLAGAQKGYKLLKKKADALTMRYRQILTKIVAAKQRMGATMKASAFALTEAKYVAGEGIKHTVLDAVEQANVRVRAHTDNVAGVKLLGSSTTSRARRPSRT